MKAFKIKQFGTGPDVKPTTIYFTSFRADEFIDRSKIDRWTRNHRKGYQRLTSESRVSKIKQKYLLGNVGVFGTSILVNVRGKIDFEPESVISENIEFGELHIPEDEPLWIVDGMHRRDALDRAIDENERFKNYPILVSIFNFEDFYEMFFFHIHNSTQKKVKTDLSIRNMQKIVEKGERAPEWALGMISSSRDRRNVQASIVVDELEERDDSPFKGKIAFPDEKENAAHPVSDYKMIRYLADVFKEKAFKWMSAGDVADLMVQYWGEIRDLWPEAFEDWNSGLTKSAGLGAFSMLFPTVHAYAVKDGDPMEEMGNVLSTLKEDVRKNKGVKKKVARQFRGPIEYEKWAKKGSPTIFRASSKRDISMLAEKLAGKIGYVREMRRGG